MNREKAKQLLELCRPGHRGDRLDPALTEAFDLLESDPALRAWFDDQQAVDVRIADQLRDIEAPADLEHSILAGMHLHATNQAESQNEKSSAKTVLFSSETRPRSSWIGPLIGIAALVLVTLVALNLPSKSTAPSSYTLAGVPPIIQYVSDRIDALSPSKFEKRDPRLEKLTHYLSSTQFPTPKSLPAMLGDMPTIGCLTFQFEGTPISMICFKNGAVYHLIIADRKSFPGELPENPQIFEINDKAFRLSVEGDQINILTIHGSKSDFPEFI